MTSSTPHISLKTGHSVAKRRQILIGARQVFIEHGYQGTSMASIATQAGVSKGTLYNYFSHKAELFSAFMKDECEKKLPLLLSPLKQNGSPAQTLVTVAKTFLELMTDRHAMTLLRIILAETQNFPHIGKIFWENGPQVVIRRLTAWIKKQNQEGKLKTDDPAFAAEQFLSLCQTRIVARLRLHLPLSDDNCNEKKVIEKAVDVFLAAYGRRLS